MVRIVVTFDSQQMDYIMQDGATCPVCDGTNTVYHGETVKRIGGNFLYSCHNCSTVYDNAALFVIDRVYGISILPKWYIEEWKKKAAKDSRKATSRGNRHAKRLQQFKEEKGLLMEFDPYTEQYL